MAAAQVPAQLAAPPPRLAGQGGGAHRGRPAPYILSRGTCPPLPSGISDPGSGIRIEMALCDPDPDANPGLMTVKIHNFLLCLPTVTYQQ